MTVTDDRFFRFVRDFLLVYLPKNRCCSENTVKSYRATIQLLRQFLSEQKNLPFSKITFDTISRSVIGEFMDWLEIERKCGHSTLNQRLAALKSFVGYAAQEDATLMQCYVELGKVPLKKVPTQPLCYLSEPALAALLQQPGVSHKRGIRDRFLMVLLYDTGARIQELLDLRIKDLHLNNSVPCVYLTGKGRKTRAVPLLKKTIEHLEVYMKHFHNELEYRDEDLLFYTVIKGKVGKMSCDNVALFLKRYAETARAVCPEIPTRVHPHLFRHTRAMHLYQSGVPLSYIKDFLGHTSVNTTDIYASADIGMLQSALEKAAVTSNHEQAISVWQDNEDLLLQLCGLQ